jgi:hypothetical protein
MNKQDHLIGSTTTAPIRSTDRGLARLSQIQMVNFQRVRQDFLRALAALKVR